MAKIIIDTKSLEHIFNEMVRIDKNGGKVVDDDFYPIGDIIESLKLGIDIDVQEFYDEMDKDEKEEMAQLLNEDINILDFIGEPDRQKMYKEFAYYVGVSDTEHLEYLIKELQYWSKK